jgi:hypothetical protein
MHVPLDALVFNLHSHVARRAQVAKRKAVNCEIHENFTLRRVAHAMVSLPSPYEPSESQNNLGVLLSCERVLHIDVCFHLMCAFSSLTPEWIHPISCSRVGANSGLS